MNKRIKELASQADNYAYKMNPEEDSYGRPANPRKFQQDRDTKFAKLIAKECADLCENSKYTFGTIFMKIIKHHFGVEE